MATTDAPLTDRELRYLTYIWKQIWREGDVASVGWVCRECWATGNNRGTMQHLPGCVFFGLPQGTLAALEAWEAVG